MTELTQKQKDLLSRVELIEGGGTSSTADVIRDRHSGSFPHPRALTIPPEVLIEYNNKICVMEAIAIIQNRGLTDTPPCVSEVITYVMQEWNDAISDRSRRHLLNPEFIAKLLHTAPTVTMKKRIKIRARTWDTQTQAYIPAVYEEIEQTTQDYNNPDYIAAEKERGALRDKGPTLYRRSFAQMKTLVLKMADVRRWEPEAEAACAVPQP